MNRIMEFVEQHKLILIVAFFFLLTRFLFYQPLALGWDESTYILIGKYFFSGGQIGFLETFRPLVWPFILGLFWKLNADPVVCGRLLTLFLSLGNIVLVYLIGRRVYGFKTGILAGFFLSLSPSFFFWGNGSLTDIPGSFVGLFALFLVLRGKYFLSGVVSMLAFFTKFVQVFTISPVACFALYQSLRKHSRRFDLPVVQYGLGCAVILVVFMAAHFVLYGNVFLPFFESKSVYTQIPYSWIVGIYYVLVVLFRIESWLFLFVPLSLIFLRRDISQAKLIVVTIAILQVIWVGKLPTEISRFILSSLPYLYLLAADGVTQCYERLKNGGKTLLVGFVAVLSLVQGYKMIRIEFEPFHLSIFQEYLYRHPGATSGKVWMSSPQTAVYTSMKFDGTMCYPACDLSKLSALHSKIPAMDLILADSKDLRCPPQEFALCNDERRKLFEEMKQNFYTEFYYEEPSTNRMWGIFKRTQEGRGRPLLNQ